MNTTRNKPSMSLNVVSMNLSKRKINEEGKERNVLTMVVY